MVFHKHTKMYMGGFVNTLYDHAFCFFKLFAMVGIGLKPSPMEGKSEIWEKTIS